MSKFLDKIADGLLGIVAKKGRVNSNLARFLNKGNNQIIILAVLFFIPFLIISIFLYDIFEIMFWAIVPFVLYVSIVLLFAIKLRIKKKLELKQISAKKPLKGFNLDLNSLIFKKLFAYLIRYGYLNEELTDYHEFFNVFTLDFHKHKDVVHFNMNLSELKYLLEKFKQLKKGLTLTSFERSSKIYNRGNLITQKGLTSAFSDNIPDKEFRYHIDDFFKFLTDI